MQTMVDKINDMVYSFQRSNHYYPGNLFIGSEALEALIREIEPELRVGASGHLDFYLDMRLIRHDSAQACYVQ